MPSKAYLIPETAITFKSTGGTVAFTPTSLAAGAGRQSAQHDFGVAARAYVFNWRGYFQSATAPVVGETVNIYAKTSDGTHIDNDDGTGDIALSAENKLKNLTFIGSITVDETTQDQEFSSSGIVTLPSRYFNVVFFNDTVDAFTSTAIEHGFILEPVVTEMQ